MKARALFVGGTSSNAGKSWMVTAICAWLHGRGVSVAPFKAQNMSNNSFPCRSGGEIGRAQVAQAEACGLEPEPAMNPILLKPNGRGSSQVIVNGRMWTTLSAREYYAHADRLRPVVLSAYQELATRFEVVVIEGAGSVTELNLRQHDLVNLGLVTQINAPWILVADIERGGVFASVVGTVHLLSAEERALFRGFVINKFRGDLSLFDDGVGILEQRTASTCFGVFPFAEIALDPEDSLALSTTPSEPAPPGARIAIIQLPHLSNATDFRLLTWAVWRTTPDDVDYDFIVIPGTKNTIADMLWLRAVGFERWITQHHRRGATIVGICGGYQMLGQVIADPDAVESAEVSIVGLGLVAARTVLTRDKRTRTVRATTRGGARFDAYEIHLGVTTHDQPTAVEPFAALEDGTTDGVTAPGVVGTYLHGALEHPAVCAEVFGVRIASARQKSTQYRRLGAWFDAHVRHLDQLGLD
jgi:adenosylcobyric acid synthase